MGIALYLTWVGGFLVTALVLTRLLKGIKLIRAQSDANVSRS